MDYQPFQAEKHLDALLILYHRAIRGLDDGLYDARQRQAWAAWGKEPGRATTLLARGITLVAVRNDQLLGFGQLWPADQINMLYVDPAAGRRGLGSDLIRQLEQHAVAQQVPLLFTRASRASQPVFRRAGFEVVAEEWVNARGVSLPRVRMVKRLTR